MPRLRLPSVGARQGERGMSRSPSPLEPKSCRRFWAFFLKSSAQWMRPVLNFSLCFFSMTSLSRMHCWKASHSALSSPSSCSTWSAGGRRAGGGRPRRSAGA